MAPMATHSSCEQRFHHPDASRTRCVRVAEWHAQIPLTIIGRIPRVQVTDRDTLEGIVRRFYAFVKREHTRFGYHSAARGSCIAHSP